MDEILAKTTAKEVKRIPVGPGRECISVVFAFNPDKSMFGNLTLFLKLAGRIAGRRDGVVKMVVPEEALQPVNRDDGVNLEEMEALVEARIRLLFRVKRIEFLGFQDKHDVSEPLTGITRRRHCQLQRLHLTIPITIHAREHCLQQSVVRHGRTGQQKSSKGSRSQNSA